MGLCTSCDAVERTDTAQVQRAIDTAGSYRVLTPLLIAPHELVHGVMDNFDHKTNTVFGHNTILMVFENIKDTKLCNEQLQINKKDISNKLKYKMVLEHIHNSKTSTTNQGFFQG